MSLSLTKQTMKHWCGQLSYKKGEALSRARKVSYTKYDLDTQSFTATVKATSTHDVSIQFYDNGDVEAECSCPTLGSYHQYCQHIAAVLINLYTLQQDGAVSPLSSDHSGNVEPSHAPSFAGDVELTNSILALFDDKPVRPISNQTLIETRELLEVEFTCRLLTYSRRTSLLGIELKLGPKQLYVVSHLKELLDRIDQRQPCRISRNFTYDPDVHSFTKENEAVIRQLIQMYHEEKTYRDTSPMYSVHAASASADRMILVRPAMWKTLLPLLKQAPKVLLADGDRKFSGIELSHDKIPLHFAFDQAGPQAYQLDVQGLEKITVLESYGMVFTDGRLITLPASQCKRLADLTDLLEKSGQDHIQIESGQMEAFMEKVIPGLKRLGNVQISKAVSEQIVQTPLQAKLYLDRVKDRLLAALEFQYGDIIINPLEAEVNGQNRYSDRLLVRDSEQERHITELIERSPFTKTEGGYVMTDEEAEYDFLYHVVPQLEKLVKIYATTAVKLRIHTGHNIPKVSVNVDVDDRINWLEFKLNMDWIPETEIRNLLQSLEEKRRYYRLPNGSLLPLEGNEFQDLHLFMSEMGLHSSDLRGTELRLPALRGLQLIDPNTQGHNVKLSKSVRQLLDNLRNPDQLDYPVPDSLASTLRDYQKFGFQWMKTLAHYGFGGVLADDMGLGKTIQSIAFIVSVLPDIRQQQTPALIISPSSLMYNWKNEMQKFAPELRVAIVDGSKTDRRRILQDVSQTDVIITSYPLLRRDYELYHDESYHTLILDEAQAFKNYATQTAKAVKLISSQYRFALTGTPVENQLEELWSIFDVVFPALFQDRKAFNNLTRDMIAKRIRPFLLRRVKTDVLQDLPEKIESLHASELLPEQKKLYTAYLAKLQQETLKHLNEGSYQQNRIKILAGLTRLRQICCHPALFVEGYKGSSSKFEQLMEIVEECRSTGKRLLLFSQFTEMLGLIGRELGYQGIPYFYLDGQTPARERVELCNRFNDGESELFLISLKAGGTGLNLTGADTVILYDLWWNPAVEQQAADRAHRIGQKNVVQVIRLVTQGTMEEKMYDLQQKKKHLIDEVIQSGQESFSSLTEQEIREILMIG
ncbi:DEAD/DEAH box helicase [Brevibacillus dissolubilis]|uniref:DEAD/DEAH box helicase n=1 Tax=Brevibacillus dissolubilis TaxID=1844116 RepID=UPI001115CAEF|nr:DEAD/DEAH box helicase [Brevibacillus dissolubilis]